jgi:Holliday junction DNA helicase RuvA
MIGYLRGELLETFETSAIILAGEVGYEVNLPAKDLFSHKIGSNLELYIYTHVREDVLALYGFTKREELTLFKKLLSVSGIGPKVALAIISSCGVEKLKASIAAGDPNILSSVSGVGKKTAEKAVIELKNKIGAVVGSGYTGASEDVYEALCGLGFNRAEVADAISKLGNDVTESEAQIKAALKLLGASR